MTDPKTVVTGFLQTLEELDMESLIGKYRSRPAVER